MDYSIVIIGIYLVLLPVASPDASETTDLAGVFSVIYGLLMMLIIIVSA